MLPQANRQRKFDRLSFDDIHCPVHNEFNLLTPLARENMLDYALVMLLGFLGSFGHCIGMCGPLTAAFSLAQGQSATPTVWRSLLFHGLLNIGRMTSYALVGGAIGVLGSVLIAGGQFSGIDSLLRRGIALFTGSLLIWMGLIQVAPALLPKIPFLHPMRPMRLHQRLNAAMTKLAVRSHPLTPFLLGIAWGLIPCGFLYAAQLKATATGDLWKGAATMLAFGLGTLPSMMGIGLSTARLSADRRSQLFRMGGWVMIAIGSLTLLRTSEMVDYNGHAALILLILALVARPLSRLLPGLMRYRRALGVGAFILSLAHTVYMLDHTFAWHLEAIPFLLPLQQVGVWAGITAMGLMIPLALTSFDSLAHRLGPYWHQIHKLASFTLVMAVIHAVLIGSHYLGNIEWAIANKVCTGFLILCTVVVFLVRWRWIWFMVSLEKFYVSSR